MRSAIDWKKLGQTAAMYLAIGTFLTFIDPYNATGSLGFGLSWLYWTGLIFVGSIIGSSAIWLTQRAFSPLHWSLEILAGALGSAAGVTVAIVGIESLRGTDIPWWYIPQLYVLVFIISAGIAGVAYLFERANAPKGPAGAETSIDPAQTFLDRLPVKYRGAALYAVSSEDHYLRVHTDKGEELILMRLADAMRELSGADGLQTHRSWWVAQSGVADASRENGKLVLKLKSGGEAPVSRTYQAAVKDAGLS